MFSFLVSGYLIVFGISLVLGWVMLLLGRQSNIGRRLMFGSFYSGLGFLMGLAVYLFGAAISEAVGIDGLVSRLPQVLREIYDLGTLVSMPGIVIVFVVLGAYLGFTHSKDYLRRKI